MKKKSLSFEAQVQRFNEEVALNKALKHYPEMKIAHYFTDNQITYITGSSNVTSEGMSRYYRIALYAFEILYADSNVIDTEYVNKGEYHADELPAILKRYLEDKLRRVSETVNNSGKEGEL